MSASYTIDDLHLLGRYRVRLNEEGRLVSKMSVRPEDKMQFKARFEVMKEATQAVQSIYDRGGHHLAALGRTLKEVPVPDCETMLLEQPDSCDDILWSWSKRKLLNQDPLEGIGRLTTGPMVNGHYLHYVYPFDRDMGRQERELAMVTGWLLDAKSRRAYCFDVNMDDAAYGCRELFQAITELGSVEQLQRALQAFQTYVEVFPPITNDMF